MYQKLLSWIEPSYWLPQQVKHSAYRRKLYAFLHFLCTALKHFQKDHCFLHTSALTYYSILSIVPIIAMGFAVAKGFGLDSYLLDFLHKPNLQNKEIWVKVVEFANVWLARTKGGLVAGVSIFVLLYTILSMMNNIEHAFNDIWKIKQHRTLVRKLTDYTTIILLFPILLVVSFGLAAFIQRNTISVLDEIHIIRSHGFVMIYLFKTLPFLMISIVFTFLYMIITNKKIAFLSAAYGGVFAGVLFQLFQNFYLYYQIKLTSYNAVYGSFAAIPFFFIWMYYSWMIILLGAELSAAHENFYTYHTASHYQPQSVRQTKLYAVLLMYELILQFQQKENQASSVKTLARKLSLPPSNIQELLNLMQKTKLICQIQDPHTPSHDDPKYVPGHDIASFDIVEVVSQIENYVPALSDENAALEEETLFEVPAHATIASQLQTLQDLQRASKANMRFTQI